MVPTIRLNGKRNGSLAWSTGQVSVRGCFDKKLKLGIDVTPKVACLWFRVVTERGKPCAKRFDPLLLEAAQHVVRRMGFSVRRYDRIPFFRPSPFIFTLREQQSEHFRGAVVGRSVVRQLHRDRIKVEFARFCQPRFWLSQFSAVPSPPRTTCLPAYSISHAMLI